MRVNDSDTFNPFGWRVAELTDPSLDPVRRLELEQSLVVCEAEEIALGRRHLTIVHGDPDDVEQSRCLDRFYEVIFTVASTAQWSRVRGDVDYVTVTIGGPGAEDAIVRLVAATAQANPGHWCWTESSYPSRH